jgi:hypothetical protein
MNMDITFDPPLDLPPKSAASVEIDPTNGRARVTIRSMESGVVLELRPECQLIQLDPQHGVIVAAPESIEHPRLSWKLRLLYWLAKG